MGSDRALLVDVNRAAVPIYEALRGMGIEVSVLGRSGAGPLSSISKRFIECDYADWEGLRTIFLEGGYDFLVPGVTDVSFLSCALVSGGELPGFDPVEAVEMLIEKDQFFELASRSGMTTPPSLTPGEACLSKGAIVVKPSDSFSGRGISVLSRPSSSELADAIEHAKSVSSSGNTLIQEFIEGQLYSHSAFVRGGLIATDFFVREDCVANSFAVDVSMMANDIGESSLNRVREEVQGLVETLKCVDGLVHSQFILRDGIPYFIDIARRCPGDLYSELIKLSTGFDYALNYVLPFLGRGQELSSRGIGNRKIVRHTAVFEQETLFGLSIAQSVLLPLIVPTAAVGASSSHSQQVRAAIMFLEGRDDQEASEIYRSLLRGELVKCRTSYGD